MPRKNSTGYEHNKVLPKPTRCDGCTDPILPDDPILFDRRIPLSTPVIREDGRLYFQERIGAFHADRSCLETRRNTLYAQAIEKSHGKPSP